MNDHNWLAERFEEHRTHLRAVAYRMLGSVSDADDAVQEAWIRLSRADTTGVENLRGWLTTVVGRVSLSTLQTRRSRREELLGERLPEPAAEPDGIEPEYEALIGDSVGLALLVVLDTLTPAERLAFVLHDMFAVPFKEIAPIVDRSPSAAKMLASRARRRVRGAATVPEVDLARQREVVGAFLAASRAGDFDALLTLLDPDVALRADRTAVRKGAPPEANGADAVASIFAGRAQGARLALVNGFPGAVWAHSTGRPRVVFDFTIARGRVIGIGMIADPDDLARLDLVLLADRPSR